MTQMPPPPSSSPIVAPTRPVPNPHWGLTIPASIIFFPIGLVSLLFSILCSSAVTKGTYDDSERYSRYAKNAGSVLLILGVLWLIFGVFLVVDGHNWINGQLNMLNNTTINNAG